MHCLYYQAHIVKEKVWFFTATLRSFEHLVFDRTFDKEKSVFEFLVPEDSENFFLQFMQYMMEQKVITSLEKKENRFTTLKKNNL